MNWGGFAGGFAQGFNNGIKIGSTINDIRKQAAIDDVRAKGMEEAKAARASEVSGMIKDNGIGVSKSEAPAPTGTKTGETAPDTAEVQTQAVPTPQAVVASPQSAVDAAPAKPVTAPPAPAAPAAPGVPAGPAVPPPVASAAPAPDATGATNPAAAGITPPAAPVRKRYSVGDASFDTIEEARAHADKNAPSVTDYFMKNTVPKISQAYMEQGDVAKAEAWDKYAKDKATQKHMDTWAKAYRAAQSGNMEKAADHVFELYKAYDDGVTPLSKETVKDKNGQITGFNVRLKDEATGEERTQFIDQRALVEMGMASLSPPAMFEQAYKRQQSADMARAKFAADAANDARTAAREDARDTRRAAREDARDARVAEREDARDARRAEREDARDDRRAKREEDNIRLRAELERGFKKTTDPAERRALVFDTLSKNDPKFARATPEEQQAKIDQAMRVIAGGKADAAAPAAPTPAPAPAPGPQSRGIPAIDTKTGKTVLLDPITRKPIQ